VLSYISRVHNKRPSGFAIFSLRKLIRSHIIRTLAYLAPESNTKGLET